MLKLTLIGALLVASTVIVHAVGTGAWLRHLDHATKKRDLNRILPRVLILTAVLFLMLHLIEILLWALAYLYLPEIVDLKTFEEAIYFSIVTFTTLGYGDVTLSGDWRVLSGIEAINGIVLIGWTTAFLFSVMQRAVQDVDST